MIDIEKFICSLLADHPEGVAVRGDIHRALKEQGLEYKDGKIVPIKDKTELKESERIRKALITAVSGMFKGNTLWHTDVTREEALAWLEKQNFNVDNTIKEYWRGYREGMQEILDKYSELEKRCADKPYYTDLLGYFEAGKRLNHSVEEIIDWLKSKI